MEEGQHEVVEDQEEEGQDKDSGMEGKEAGRRREARTGLEPAWIWSFTGRGTPPQDHQPQSAALGHKTLGEIPSRQLPPPGSPRGPSRRSTRVASVHSSAEKGLREPSVSLGLGDPHPSEQGLWAARFSNLMGKPEANRDTVPSGVRRSPQLSPSRSRGGGCLAQEPSPTGLLGTGASVPGAPSLRPSRQGGRLKGRRVTGSRRFRPGGGAGAPRSPPAARFHLGGPGRPPRGLIRRGCAWRT